MEIPTEIIILFDSGVYQEIPRANRLGGNPVSILETNVGIPGIPKSLIDQLPKRESGIFARNA
jgi:hypothetical protein